MIQKGHILNNTYEIIGQIGSGGGGIIFKAYHLRMKKFVALKLVKDNVKSDFYNRSEVDVLKNLKNDYLPQVLDFVEEGDDVYTVMEFVEGKNLRQHITDGRSFSEKEVIKYALQLCEAVGYLHNHVPPIIHSDIKPSNVMLTPEDNICLIDFNISIMTSDGYAVSRGGSNNFSAPEQFKRIISPPTTVDDFHEHTRFISSDEETEIISDDNSGHSVSNYLNNRRAFVDVRTDIYGIGATLYYILTGRIPRNGKMDFKGVKASAKLRNCILKATAANPYKRYKNIGELKAALLNKNGRSVPNKPIIILIIIAFALAVSGIAMLVFNDVKPNEIKEEEDMVFMDYENTSESDEENISDWNTEDINGETEIDIRTETEEQSKIIETATSNVDDLQIIVLPSFIGNKYTDVISTLQVLGLEYELEFSQKKYVDVGENCVYYQSPKSGTEVVKGDLITIGISTYNSGNVTTSKVTTAAKVSTTTYKATQTITSTTSIKTTTPTTVSTATAKTTTTKKITSKTSATTTEKYYTVKFHINDKVETQKVKKGENAIPPKVSDSNFIGWSGNYKNVTKNVDIYARFSEETTTTKTTAQTEKKTVGYDGTVLLLLNYGRYSLDKFNLPIEDTTWSDYTWSSSDTSIIEIYELDGVIETHVSGSATLTLTYKYNAAIRASAKVRVVSEIK